MRLIDWFAPQKDVWSELLWNGMTDFHCHLLPGVDDGVQQLDDALNILQQYDAWGITDVWCTPHIMEDIPNKTIDLQEQFHRLVDAFHGNLRLHLAAEYMLDSLFTERLEQGDLLPIGKRGDMLLVETSYFNAPMRFNELIQAIQSAGFHPLLAHPERYRYMTTTDYRDLRDKNVRFQLNIGSLTGMYGIDAQKKASRLLDDNQYYCFGSDLHQLSTLRQCAQLKYSKIDAVRTIELPIL